MFRPRMNVAEFMMLGCLALLVAYLLGWFSRPSAWTTTTGWNRIPAELRPRQALRDEFELRWLGHSGFVLQWQGSTILLDPNLAGHCTVSKRILEMPRGVEDIRRIDAICISHAHYDHLNIDTLQGLPAPAMTLLPEGSEIYFSKEEAAHDSLLPVAPGTIVKAGALEIIPVPAAHNGNRFHPLRSRKSAVGYIIRSPTRTLYYAGDTAAHNDFAAIRDRYHPDVAILPIGAYAPRYPLKLHHMNPEEAAEAAVTLGVSTVVPCHFGTFTLSFDRPSFALPRFAAAAALHELNWAMPEFLDHNLTPATP